MMMNEVDKQQLQIQMLAASRELDRLIDKYKTKADDLESIPFSDKMLDVQSKIRSLNVLLSTEKKKFVNEIAPGTFNTNDTNGSDE
jgi:hypothetical protein